MLDSEIESHTAHDRNAVLPSAGECIPMNRSLAEHGSLESAPCPNGCAHLDDRLLAGRDRLHEIAGRFAVVRCRKCGLIRTDPRPSVEQIVRFYPDEYHPHAKSASHSRIVEIVRHTALRILNMERIPRIPPGRMLEIGCGQGLFLSWMAERGWNVEGIELTESAGLRARARGLRVHIGPLEYAPEPQSRFDLVVGWHVLEHLHDPAGSLRRLRSWTAPGGWAVFSLPNSKSLGFKVFKDRWFALDLPRHLYHYCPSTLSALLDTAGWSVEKVHHQRTLDDLVASLGYVLSDSKISSLANVISPSLRRFPSSLGAHVLTSPILFPVSWLLALLKRSGSMTVWARREKV